MSGATFTTVLNCMDGRIQEPVLSYVREDSGCPYVDNLALPGPARAFSEEGEPYLLGLIEKGLRVSVEVHGSNSIYLVAHHDCAGCPGGKAEQLTLLRQAEAQVRDWFPHVKVKLLWVNEEWKVEPVT